MKAAGERFYVSVSTRASGRWYRRAKDSRSACKQHESDPENNVNRRMKASEHKLTHLPSTTGYVKCTRQMVFFDFVVAVQMSE